jgi:integrase
MPSTSYGATTRTPLIKPNGNRVPNGYERTLGDGTIVAEFNGRGPDGKMIKKTFRATTKTERIRLVEAFAADLRRGQVVLADRSVTVATLVVDFVAQCETRVGSIDPKHRIAKRTAELYKQRLEQHILPALGKRRLPDLTVADLRGLIDKLRAKGLAPATINGVLIAFSSALRFAVKRNLIASSPMQSLDRDDRPGTARMSEPRYLSDAEIDALLAKTGDQFRSVLAVCANGLRIAETLGLRWSDIDFDAKTIGVEAQLGTDGKRVQTKTKASAGTVPLTPRAERELRAWRSRQAERDISRLHAGELVFTTMTGKPQGRRNAFRALSRAADAAGLNPEGVEPLGLHDLRHSFAGALFASGKFTLPEISTLMRHASVQVTATVYAGLTDQGRAALGSRLLAAGVGA